MNAAARRRPWKSLVLTVAGLLVLSLTLGLLGAPIAERIGAVPTMIVYALVVIAVGLAAGAHAVRALRKDGRAPTD